MTTKLRIAIYAAILTLAALVKTTNPMLVAEDPIPQCPNYPDPCQSAARN